MIEDDNRENSITNVFCFGAFADKVTGVVYNDLTGNFPFMSLDGSVCFFVMYHYVSNSILATPIANLDDKSLFEAFTAKFKMLEEKRYLFIAVVRSQIFGYSSTLIPFFLKPKHSSYCMSPPWLSTISST